ncbi:MAG TPA: tetratricopeptide repeat protein [Vicinamibacterales bacterium]|nr:tetratricopeptide repeat protein [Vicinamibacterales bacterium]
MANTTLACVLALTFAIVGRAQSPATTDAVSQQARVDAQFKMWRTTATQLLARAEVKALRLKSVEVEAYTAVILDAEPRARVDLADAARRMALLHKDQDATYDIVDTWTGMQQLHQKVARAAAPERARLLTALKAKHLSAQASAALARTEESAVGGRAPTAEGRERAKQLADAAVALAPDSPDAREVMGDLFIDASEPESAEDEFRKALIGENSAALRTKLAEALRLQGDFDEAITELRDAIKLEPGFARAHSGLGLALRALRNLPESTAAYEEAIRLDPDLIDAHNGLAVVLANQGKLNEAVAQFREIIRVDPDSAIGYYNLSYALADLDRDVESAAALREVVRINPNHYNARFNLGELFRLEGKYDESVKQFREYLRLAPDAPQNRRNIDRAKGYIQKFGEP